MCKTRPAPRCASHARKALMRAIKTEQNIVQQYQSGGVDDEQLARARKVRVRAQLDYDSTPTGQRELTELISRAESGQQKELLRQRLSRAQQHREAMIRCAALHSSAKQALFAQEALLEQEEQELVQRETKFQEAEHNLRAAAAEVEDAQAELNDLKSKIRQFYLEQGDAEKANLPALWIADPALPSDYKEQLTSGRRKIKDAMRHFEQAQRVHAQAHAQYRLGVLNVRMVKAEIASGLHSEQNTGFKHYGQIFVNKDGSTNARMLTKIPHTNTEVFARVRTLTGDYAVLETGTKVKLTSKITPSHWRFEEPEDGAQRGPQVFTMQSSAQ